MSKITKLIVLNGNHTLTFEVGYTTVDVSDSKVKKIKQDERKPNNYIVFLQDGNEVDVVSNNVITHTKIGVF